MKYCIKCGKELAPNAKFCHECGAQIDQADASVRKTVYDGEIHKCPNCGGVLDSFTIECPNCGMELRGVQNSNSIQTFVRKLEAIDEKETSGKIFKFNSSKKSNEQRVNLIKNFSIPNTKEDILEFMILASSNISGDMDSEITKAWQAKVEQAYQKAKISCKSTAEFREIERIYLTKKSEKRRAKVNESFKWVSVFLLLILEIFLLLGVGFLIDKSDNAKITAENERLEKIVEEVYWYIEQEQYTLARSKVSTIVFSGSTTRSGNQAASKWDVTRTQLLDIIDKAEFGEDYIPIPREIRIGADHDDLIDEDYIDVKTQLENRGFTNIKTEPIADLTTGWWTSEGSVDKVSVDGDTVFSEDAMYSSNAEIIIYYHTKK